MKDVSACLRAHEQLKTDQGYFQLCILHQLQGLAYRLLRALTMKVVKRTILTQRNWLLQWRIFLGYAVKSTCIL